MYTEPETYNMPLGFWACTRLSASCANIEQLDHFAIFMRTTFDLAKVPAISWFPGHMAAALKQMRKRLQERIDWVLEVRDARVATSCRNSAFEELFRSKKRIIIYNKMDLANLTTLPVFDEENVVGVLGISAKTSNSKEHVKVANEVLDLIRQRYLQPLAHSFKLVGMVVGMPNVGKSTLINTLRTVGTDRNGKAVGVGKLPGFTKRISGQVKVLERPPFYVMDTPGVMIPKIADKEAALKMALCASIKESVVGVVLIADYLLFRLNLLSIQQKFYVEYFHMDAPTDDVIAFLTAIAIRFGLLKKGGHCDLHQAAVKAIRLYNDGFFGPFSLDS